MKNCPLDLNKLLQNTNYWYKNAFETDHGRRPGFFDVLSDLNCQPANILEIGATGGDINDPNGIHGSGHSTFYFAEYVRQYGGSLTIVELNPEILNNCKIMVDDLVKCGTNIQFINDDGANWVKKKFDLYYLDAGDIEWQTFEMFKKIDTRNGSVLLDDWNNGGKCDRVKTLYPFYSEVYKCDERHQMGYYRKMEDFGEKKFNLGDLELSYYRGWNGNREATNERAVEIALGKYFISKFDGDVTELGAVMPYYANWSGRIPDRVVDPYDSYSGCLRIDGEKYDFSNQNVLSLSTLEHIGNDSGYDKERDGKKAVGVLEKIVKESRNYLLVWGIGQHAELDTFVQNSSLPVKIMVRKNVRGLINNWREDNDKKNFYLTYGNWDMACGYYGHSLGLAIITNLF